MSDTLPENHRPTGYDWFRKCWNVVPLNAEECSVFQTHRRQADCFFVETRIGACRGRRGEDEIVHSEEDGLYVTLYSAGGLTFSARSEETVMRAGDMLLWDTSLAGSFECTTETTGRTILFPRAMVERRLGHGKSLYGMQPDRGDPRTALLRSHFEKLHDLVGKTREDVLKGLLESSLELTYLCMVGDEDISPTRGARVLFEEAKQDIRDHLGSEELTPAALAGRLQTSVRGLQNALSAHGTTFTALVMKERMRRATQMLRSPACRNLSISEIALALGFYDNAHFSNAFRRYHRISPRQYRKLQ